MAHNLMEHDHMVSGNNIVPWHKLGTVVDGLMTAEECLKLARLDWNVSVQPLKVDFDGEMLEFPGHFATVRDDIKMPLGPVKGRYTPLQNVDAFSFFDALVSEKEAMYETAGSLQNGRKVWILAKLPNDIIINKEDEIRRYALIYTSHDGSAKCRIKLVDTRVVCANTVSMALSENGREISISHTPNIKDKVREAHKTLGMMNKMQQELKEAYEAMYKVQVPQSEAILYLNNCLKLDLEHKDADFGKLQKLLELAETGRGTDLPGIKGSLWGYYNAVTEYTNHEIAYRNDETRMREQAFGQADTINNRALELAMSML